jgi:hypothetical protein
VASFTGRRSIRVPSLYHAPADFSRLENTLGSRAGDGPDAVMRFQVSKTAPAGDLKAYLEEAQCVVHVLDLHTLEVSIRRASSGAQALRER